MPLPPGVSPGLSGGLKMVTRIEPFTTAVVLPTKKELLTFGFRPPGETPAPGGTIRRYAADTFKLLGTYHLPHPVTAAAADEKAGRLYLGTAARDTIGFDVQRLTVVGDVAAPTAAQASRAFATAPTDRPVMVAFSRGRTHHLIAVEKTW